ncbi:racemase [Pelagibacteraceae bacterium]|jgi:maleate isomerase|nr:racemase [Pelagibacteraceae bacterium]|tara:strand:+ start:726 stop:1475 length:750 start_codon:yes stop_codon:yes gene_type:complete
MGLSIKHINSKFKKKNNPKVGLIALSTDQTIEGDFYTICKNLPLDIFVNRIHNQNPLTKENLLKMQDDLELVTSKILPDERINTIAYGCTSGTIAIGEDKVKEKILLAKQDCYVTTPVTSAIKAFKQMNVRKIALFTPYPDAVNKTILDYFTQKSIEVSSFTSLNLNLDSEIAQVDPNYILEISSKLEIKNADALFISCTALPVLDILDKLENKIQKPVLSSNQTLIWDTIRSVGCKSPIKGYGKLLEN